MPPIHICIIHKRAGVRAVRAVEIDGVGILGGSWVGLALRKLEVQTIETPIQRASLSRFLATLKRLNDPVRHVLCERNLRTLSEPVARHTLEAAANAIAETSNWQVSTQRVALKAFKQILKAADGMNAAFDMTSVCDRRRSADLKKSSDLPPQKNKLVGAVDPAGAKPRVFINIHTRSIHSTKTRYPIVSIDVSNISEGSWVKIALEYLNKNSIISPILYASAYVIRSIISALHKSKEALCEKQLSELSENDVVTALSNLDVDISAKRTWSDGTRVANCTAFRKFLKLPGVVVCGGAAVVDLLQRKRTSLKSGWRVGPQHSSAIPWPLDDNGNAAEIKALSDLQNELGCYGEAASQEIRNYFSVCQQQNDLEAKVRDDVCITEANRNHSKQEIVGKVLSDECGVLSESAIGILLSIYSEETIRGPVAASYGLQLRLPSHRRLPDVPQKLHYLTTTTVAPWFYARHRLPNAVLTAIFVLLATRTSWNISSIANLNLHSFKPTPDDVKTIQGFKSKTDDDTPIFSIEKWDTTLRKAIMLLAWNIKQLKKMAFIPEHEQRVWFGWQRDGYKEPIDPIGSKLIDKFIEKNGIKPTPISSLRDINAQISYLQYGSLEYSREILGHRDIEITCKYLNNTVVARIYEAMICRFQVELDSTAIFLTRNTVGSVAPQAKHINVALLTPTGDGGLCDDPCDGPPNTSLVGSTCDGTWCHAFGTCKHYKLIITTSSLVDAIRTYNYYRASWNSLIEQNPVRYAEIHIPRIIFLLLLVKLAQDAAPDLLQEAKSIVASANYES